MIRIRIFYDGKPVNEFEQKNGNKEITIGRAPGCAIRLDEASISRLHAIIRLSNGAWVLERKASFGAVLLNGQEVENAMLQGGEEITLGKFSLSVVIENESTSGGKQALAVSSSGTRGVFREDDNGKTRVLNVTSGGLFRFEPGTANVSEFAMDREIAVFGRGSNCDVVLMEKKSSRKHIEIRRQGLSFFLKDLNSANGTLVNGKPISEVELVPGDVIQIGEGKIQFTIENKEFFAKQDQFLSVPSHLEELAPADFPGNEGFSPESGPNYGEVPQAESPAVPVEPEEKSAVKKLVKKYRALPPIQRYIVILVFFAFVVAFFQLGDNAEPLKPVAKKAPAGHERDIEYISKEKKKVVEKLYTELSADIQNKEYLKARDVAPRILEIVNDYKDTKEYQRLANEFIEKEEVKAREKAKEEATLKLRKEVEALENRGKDLYEKALKDQKYRLELNQLIQEIYSKDPNDHFAGDWQAGIAAKIESDKQEQLAAEAKDALRKKADTAFDAVMAIFKNGEYISALAEAEKLPQVGYSEKDFLDKVAALKVDIRAKLHSVIDPLLKNASEQGKEGGDLVKAKELYMQVLKIDAANPEAQKGLDSIREVLHTRARRFYAEAILSESISDLSDAKDKYAKCEKTAPDDDAYRMRCHNKLARFTNFGPDTGP